MTKKLRTEIIVRINQSLFQKSEIIYFCVAANGWIGTMLVNNC